jgi:hypothetical protein
MCTSEEDENAVRLKRVPVKAPRSVSCQGVLVDGDVEDPAHFDINDMLIMTCMT